MSPDAETLCCRTVLKLSLTAGGASAAARRVPRRGIAVAKQSEAYGYRQQQCELWRPTRRRPRRGRARCRAGRGVRASRAEMTTPRRMVMRHLGGARSGSNVSRSGAFGRRSRTKARASQPWIHAAFRPCGTRAAFAATNVAAQAGAKQHNQEQRHERGSLTQPLKSLCLNFTGRNL